MQAIHLMKNTVTRKYDTRIHFLGYGRRELQLSGHQRMIVVSKNYRIVEVGDAVSLFTPLNHYKVIWAWENLTLY